MLRRFGRTFTIFMVIWAIMVLNLTVLTSEVAPSRGYSVALFGHTLLLDTHLVGACSTGSDPYPC